MLAGVNNGGNAGATCEAYWREMPTGFKFLCVSTLILGVLGMITSLFTYMFVNLVVWTVNSFQIWRLLTSFLVDNSIINVIINLYILSMSLPLLVPSLIFRKKCIRQPICSFKSSSKHSSVM